LTRPEAVTLALFALGGAETPADTEDVAMRVAELAPGMFAWRKYPEQIDKELVRVALSDARLKKRWVVGSHDKGGWLLTPVGQEFARSSSALLRLSTTEHQSPREARQHDRERARLMTSAAYERFLTDGVDTVSEDEADAFFRINVYVEGQARERKIARVENQFGDDPELGDLVRQLAQRALRREHP
jgi:hypothetical protein